MAASVLGGPITWELERDNEGHRTYKVVHRVKTDDAAKDGLNTVLNATGIPKIGDAWSFLSGNDVDTWAFCLPQATIRPDQHKEGDPHRFYRVEQTFSTKPVRRCQDSSIQNPVLEPDKISGSFSRYTEENVKDRNSKIVKSSSHEVFTGPQVEWDASRPSVTIEQNRFDLELELLAELVNKVNDAPLWGLAARKVKLSSVSWEEKWYGTCNKYYTRRLEFDINFDTFDRNIPDQGTKVLDGSWDKTDPNIWNPKAGTDKNNPRHFIKFTDNKGHPTKTLLDGNGNPLTNSGGAAPVPVDIKFERYTQDNLLKLGIPTTIG